MEHVRLESWCVAVVAQCLSCLVALNLVLSVKTSTYCVCVRLCAKWSHICFFHVYAWTFIFFRLNYIQPAPSHTHTHDWIHEYKINKSARNTVPIYANEFVCVCVCVIRGDSHSIQITFLLKFSYFFFARIVHSIIIKLSISWRICIYNNILNHMCKCQSDVVCAIWHQDVNNLFSLNKINGVETTWTQCLSLSFRLFWI